jgi:protease II
VQNKKKTSESEPESERVKVLHTISRDLYNWLRDERRKTGRSVTHIVETALNQYRSKIEKGRKL